jgi:ComF family protein
VKILSGQFRFKLILDFFFPLHCLSCGQEGQLACPKCRAKIALANNPDNLTSAKISAVADYQDPLVAGLIHALKYQGWTAAAPEMAEIILQHLNRQSGLTAKILNPGDLKVMLVPVPLSTWRQGQRGYNQAELLAKALQPLAPERFEVCPDLVKKIRHTISQVEIKERHKRLINLAGAFALSDGGLTKVRGRRLLLLDDVTTTGATFNELKKLFRAAGAAEIICLAFAHG